MDTSDSSSGAAEVRESVRALAPIIADNRDGTEKDRQLAPAIVLAIKAAGLQRLTLTRENGGLEVPLPTALEVYEQLAGFDASVGWIVWNNALPCLFSRFLPPATRAEVFADPDWLHASSTRPSGKAVREAEGYRLTGRWSLVSGCELAEWMPLTGFVIPEGGGEPEMRYFFMRRSELEILDTWHAGGLRGTGSHDVAVNDFLVPLDRSISPANDVSTATGPYGRIPIISTLSLGMAAQFVGIAGYTLQVAITQATTRITSSPAPDMRDRPDVQQAIATHTAAVEAARSHLFGQADLHWRRAQNEEPQDASHLATLYAASNHAIRTAVAAVDELYSLCGTEAIYRESPLERISRDLRVMRQHVLTQTLWPEQSGRVMLGLSVNNPLYTV
jgi:alkylation response protein AidB-like acyl-CoA dehydrogenase